ncbi:hypothetical protein CEE45_16815 [Candidatus Heimdallarchaeota archaeon B3_Heim]|nr:MAG: hypothetical protein CEE45_16815 [Candidatus Heimdallarchaeota archaeon B3_Heim]
MLCILFTLLIWHFGSLHTASLFPARPSYRLPVLILFVVFTISSLSLLNSDLTRSFSFPLNFASTIPDLCWTIDIHLNFFNFPIITETPYSTWSLPPGLLWYFIPPFIFSVLLLNFLASFLAIVIYSFFFSPSLATILSFRLASVSKYAIIFRFFVFLEVITSRNWTFFPPSEGE